MAQPSPILTAFPDIALPEGEPKVRRFQRASGFYVCARGLPRKYFGGAQILNDQAQATAAGASPKNPAKIILSPALGMGDSIQPQRNQNTFMNGYPFTAGLTQTQVVQIPRGVRMVDSLQTWDSCASAIICGGDPEQAQERFEA